MFDTEGDGKGSKSNVDGKDGNDDKEGGGSEARILFVEAIVATG